MDTVQKMFVNKCQERTCPESIWVRTMGIQLPALMGVGSPFKQRLAVKKAFVPLECQIIAVGCLLFPWAASGQVSDTVQISAEVSCMDCRIVLEAMAVLGTENGEDFLHSSNEVAAGTRHFYVVNRLASTEIQVFSRDGNFLRTVGRIGEGPGEYKKIYHLWVSPGDTLHVIDASNSRRTLLTPDFETVEVARLPGRGRYHGYFGLSTGEAVLAAIAPDSAGDVRLLHRLDQSGSRSLSFGPPLGEADYSNTGPTVFARKFTETENGELLVVPGNEFVIESYSPTGTLTRVYEFTGREFLDLIPGGGVFPGYLPRIQDVWIDDEEYLWVMMRVGDVDWEEGVERVGVGFGRRPSVTLSDHNLFWDTVIEVVDLKRGRTVARERFETSLVRFLGNNEVVGMTYLEGMTIRLPFFRARIEDGPGTMNQEGKSWGAVQGGWD